MLIAVKLWGFGIMKLHKKVSTHITVLPNNYDMKEGILLNNAVKYLMKRIVPFIIVFMMLVLMVHADGEDVAAKYDIEILLAPCVDSLEKPQDGMIRFESNEKYGYLNEDFKEVIPAKYDYSSDFHDGLAYVEKEIGSEALEGVIDRNGNVIFPFEYADIRYFKDGIAVVRKKYPDGRYKEGVVDKTGRLVLPTEYDEIKPFSNGLSVVSKDGKYGVTDLNGTMVIPLGDDKITIWDGGQITSVSKEGSEKYWVIDKDGKVVPSDEYEEIYPFVEDMALFQKDGKWGYIDRSGEQAIPAIYDNADVFSEGMALVQQGDKCAYINKSGDTVLPFEYDIDKVLYNSRFYNDFAKVYKNGKYGVIDKTNAVVIPLEYDGIDDYQFSMLSEYGITPVVKDGNYGLADANGNLVVDCTLPSLSYDYLSSPIEPFSDGYAFFTDGEGNYGIVSTAGEITARGITASPCYSYSFAGGMDMRLGTYFTDFHEGLAAVHIDNKWGYINPAGEIVIEPQFDSPTPPDDIVSGGAPGAEPFQNGYAKVYKDGGWNMIDKQGNLMLDRFYDSVTITDNYYICQSQNGALKILTKDWETVLSGEKGLVTDENGNIILQFDAYEPDYSYYKNTVEQYKDNLFVYKMDGKTGIFSVNKKPLQQITVYCNGALVEFDQPPIMEDDRVLVPMRLIFEALGADVIWDDETQMVTAVRDDVRTTLKIGDDKIYVNDREIQLDVPAKLISGRTLVPIRAISEAFGADVEWDENIQQVKITCEQSS